MGASSPFSMTILIGPVPTAAAVGWHVPPLAGLPSPMGATATTGGPSLLPARRAKHASPPRQRGDDRGYREASPVRGGS